MGAGASGAGVRPIHYGPAPPFGPQVRAEANDAREETVAASQSYAVTIVGGGLGMVNIENQARI